MAVVVGIKIKAKAPKRDPLFADEKHLGTEPQWDYDRAVEFDHETFERHLRKSLRYYNYFYNAKDLRKDVVKWIQTHTKFDADQLTRYIQSNPDATPITVCSLIKAQTAGMPLKEKHRDYIMGHLHRIIGNEPTINEPKSTEVKIGYRPTIQDRLNEKTADTIGEIEGQVDLVFKNQPTTMKVYDFLTVRNIAQSQVGKIKAVFQRQANEIAELTEGTCAQLKEGYSFLKKSDIKRITEFYTALISDLDAYTQVKKTTKAVRKPRAVNKEKLVGKMKFLKESKELKLVSVNPLDILNANTLWVYNTRTRKLGKYVADSHSGTLGIKGTSIIGYDETQSVCKTLRKPAEQLKEFMTAGKVVQKKFLDGINAVSTKMNGRISADILLLKVQ